MPTAALDLPAAVPAPLGRGDGPAWMRLVAGLVAALPYRWLRPVGAWLGLLAGTVLRIRRRHVEASLRAAGIQEPTRVARAMYASLGTGLCELLWIAGRPRAALDGCWRLADGAAERFEDAARRGRGVIVATAHLGNWDLAACATARWRAGSTAGVAERLLVVTKRLSWRALDRTWQCLRAERGVELVDVRGALGSVRAALAAGGAVAMLVDQAPERTSGVAVFPFLGSPARHDLAPAVLAARTGAPIVVAASHRAPTGEHVLDVLEVVEPPPPRASRAAVVEAMQRVATAIERAVRARPEQWLWLHRRWKDAGRRETNEHASRW